MRIPYDDLETLSYLHDGMAIRGTPGSLSDLGLVMASTNSGLYRISPLGERVWAAYATARDHDADRKLGYVDLEIPPDPAIDPRNLRLASCLLGAYHAEINSGYRGTPNVIEIFFKPGDPTMMVSLDDCSSGFIDPEFLPDETHLQMYQDLVLKMKKEKS